MVNMKGSTRLLDKVLADNGTASARTLEVYGVTSIDELLNVPMLVKSNTDGVDTATMKINTFDAKDIKIMKGTEKVSPYNQWVMSGQLYQLIYDGFQFVAYPLGASGGNESNDYSVMKLDFNAFSTSTKDNLVTNVGAETLGELLYNLEQNVDCDYTFIKNSNNETMNMPCIFNYHEYVSSLSLHTVMLSTFYDKTLYTFTIEYSYGADDSLTVMAYNISQISLTSINDFKYSGATAVYRMKSSTTPSLGNDPIALEEVNKTLNSEDLFTLSEDGTYITVNKSCMLEFKGYFYIENASNASTKNAYIRVLRNGYSILDSNWENIPSNNSNASIELTDYDYKKVNAGDQISVTVRKVESTWDANLSDATFCIHCAALA